MSTYLSANGFTLAYGLTWASISTPKRESAEAGSFARSIHAEYKVRWQSRQGQPGIKYAFAKDVKSAVGKQKKGTLLSAAILFASLVPRDQNSLLFYRIGDKRTAIVALLAGEQYLDVVVDSATALDTVHRLYEEGHGTYVTYGNNPAFPDCEQMSPDTLLNGDKSAASLVKFVDPTIVMHAMLIGAAVLAIGAGAAWWKGSKDKREAQEAHKRTVDPAQAYIVELKRLLLTAGFNGKAASSAIWNVVKARDADVGGWQLQRIECVPTQCKETWSQGTGDFQTFNATIAGQARLTLVPGSSNLTNVVAIDGKRTELPAASLPANHDFWTMAITQQQRLHRVGIDYVPSAAAIVGLPPNVLSGSLSENMVVLKGQLKVSAPLGFANEILLDYLPSNISVDELSFDLSGDVKSMKFNIKGSYYVKQ